MDTLDANVMDIDNNGIDVTDAKKIFKLSINKFIILSIVTLGFYDIWWIYKSWRFFQDLEKSDIMPAMRTIFGIFFIIPLFDKINKLAQKHGYEHSYASTALFIGYLVVSLLSYLPKPFYLLTLFSFLFIIPPMKALNFAMDHCEGFTATEQQSFNGRQIFLLIIGGVCWGLILFGLFQ